MRVLVAVCAAASPRLMGVTASGPAESVYDWETQHCATGRPLAPCAAPCHPTPYRRDVPDAPAMAWRDPTTNTTFLAPGDSRGTWAATGPSLDAVKHDCGLMVFNYSGPQGFLPSPAQFSSHEWLYAPYVVQRGGAATLYMLVHNEFHGWEHFPELCNATSMVDGRCWYNSVTLSVSRDGGRNIAHAAPPPQNLVAASPDVYEPNQGPYGVFSPSQIVRSPRDGFLYSFPRCRSKAGVAGVCMMRTTEAELGDPTSWRFWTGKSFAGQFFNPYVKRGTEPALLDFGGSGASFSQPVPRYVPHVGVFVMAGYCNMRESHTHFGVSVAPEPWGPWTAPQPIQGLDLNPAHDEPATGPIYPSLLDPASPSLQYETLESDEAYLYWVQGRNKAKMHAPDMARDLWRQKVYFSWTAELLA